MKTILMASFFFASASSNAFSEETPRFDKLNAVLNHLGVPAERSYHEDVKSFDKTQTSTGFQAILKHVDPKHNLDRYILVDTDKVILFQDRDTKKVVDFSLEFKPNGRKPSDSSGLIATLRRAAKNPPDAPLRDLRIALDPGHMGSKRWDQITGKYVRTRDGRHVSEGELALHTCLLLARRLEELGAQVMLTRTTLTEVSAVPYDSFDLAPHWQHEIRMSTDQAWFDRLLESSPPGPKLFSAFERHPKVMAMKHPRMRVDFYLKQVDLTARADLINAFNPHLTLIVHFDSPDFDASPPRDREAFALTTLQTRVNAVRAYVPGNFLPSELASREARAQAMRILFDGHRWVESNVLSSSLVAALNEKARIPIKTNSADVGAVRVGDGVYARNLALNRYVSKGATAYLEILHYNYKDEFDRLAVRDRSAEIDGIRFEYSSRLEEIVDGLNTGVLNYVKSNQRAQNNDARP